MTEPHMFWKCSPFPYILIWMQRLFEKEAIFGLSPEGAKCRPFTPRVKRDTCSRHLLYTHRRQQQHQQCNAFISPSFHNGGHNTSSITPSSWFPTSSPVRYHSMTPLNRQCTSLGSNLFVCVSPCNGRRGFSFLS